MIESADLFEAKIKRYFDLHFNLLEVDIANAFSGSAKSAEIKSISESVNRTVYRVNGSRIKRDPVFAKHQLKTLQGRFPVMDGAPLLRRLTDGHEQRLQG